MHFKNKKNIILLIILINIVFVKTNLYANVQEAFDASKADYEYDLGLIMGWFSDQFAKVMSFGGSCELNSAAEVLNPGGTDLGLVVNGFKTKLDTNAYRRLNTIIVNTSTNTPSGDLPFGGIIFMGRYGISDGYDIGIKSGGLSIEPPDNKNIAIKNNILGAEIRMQMQKRKTSSFDITGAVGLNFVNGYIDIKSSGTVIGGQTLFEGTTYYQNGMSFTENKVNWNFTSISLRAVASTRIAFITPLLGLQVDINTGQTKGEFIQTGNLTLTDVIYSSNTQTANTNFAGTGNSTIPQVNLRILGGIEFNFSAVQLGMLMESAADNNSYLLYCKLRF